MASAQRAFQAQAFASMKPIPVFLRCAPYPPAQIRSHRTPSTARGRGKYLRLTRPPPLSPFPTSHTHDIVSDPRTDDIVSWSKDGKTFIVWKPEEFVKLLPKTLHLFTQPFASFVNELNVYGFTHYGSGNAEGDYFEFGQDGFQKGRPKLMYFIRQKQNFGRYRH